MNQVILTGRLTKDPETRHTANTVICTFSIAVDRDGEKTDYPRIKVFGKQAENCEKYLKKGRLCGVRGSLQTGSYTDKNGATVFTTDVIADRVEFLDRSKLDF